MTTFTPSFTLYASDGSTPVYAFEYITETNWPTDSPSFIEHTNLRSAGSIIVPGGDKPYDLYLKGFLYEADYTALTTAIFNLRDTIVNNTRYVLKCEKSSGVFDSIKVMRVLPIILEPSKRVTVQRYEIILRASSWA